MRGSSLLTGLVASLVTLGKKLPSSFSPSNTHLTPQNKIYYLKAYFITRQPRCDFSDYVQIKTSWHYCTHSHGKACGSESLALSLKPSRGYVRRSCIRTCLSPSTHTNVRMVYFYPEQIDVMDNQLDHRPLIQLNI